MLKWFLGKEQNATTVTVTAESDWDRLQIVEDRYQRTKALYFAASEREREYRMSHQIPPELFIRDGKAYVPINATERSDAAHDTLKTAKEHARQAFCRALAERSAWRKRMGLVR
jgi:hypothetical protein